MLFSSVEFLIFFVVFFCLYWAIRRSVRWQNLLLLAASYFFYGWWDWRFLILIVITTVSTWGSAIVGNRTGRRRLFATINIVLNLGILVLFKYLNFFSENLVRLFGLFGWNIDWFTVDVLLPVGISFYTLQAIGYSIDVYRGKNKPCHNIVTFATFIAFFPQLLAGPIERASDLIPQIRNRRRWNYSMAVDGAKETLWGLFKKVAIADVCGVYVDSVYGTLDGDDWKLAVAAILFAIQIYCDFSGYSNMARGVAAMLGIRLSVNFRYPFFSRNPMDFWHRWHISLMTWLRDYIYIPLGGSRCGRMRTYLNLMLIFFLSGLWHGAAWNFLLWGAMWGVTVVSSHIANQRRYRVENLPTTRLHDMIRLWGMALITVMTFVAFRLDDVDQIIYVVFHALIPVTVILCMVLPVIIIGSYMGRRSYMLLVAVIAMVFAISWATAGIGPTLAMVVISVFPLSVVSMFISEWNSRGEDFGMARISTLSPSWRVGIYWILLLTILISTNGQNQFIYFQF